MLILLLILTTVFEVEGQVVFDTVETTNVGPGVVYKRIIAPAVPWSINVLEVDLKDSTIFFETVKAKDKLQGFETVSSMAERNDYDGHTVVGAVNGDFYNTGNGVPTNMQISKGEIVKGTNGRPVIGFDINNLPFIGKVNYSGEIINKDSSIAGINTSRGTDQLILYNHFFGASTETNNFGTEISISPFDNWLVNDTIRCLVINKEDGIGSMDITDTTAVLSGHGISKEYLDNVVSVGDTIKLINKLAPWISKLKELVGGYPQIVTNGNNTGDNVSREPRTSIGFSEDTTKLYIFTVDGRAPGFSVGMTFSEFADFMIANGVYTGLNLDGGGSTTMVLRDSVVNSPSNGSERAVSNGLLILTKVDKGNLSSVQISPDYFKLYYGETLQFKLQGFDEFYNPVTINSTNVQYSLSHNFGSLTPKRFFTAGNSVDTGYIFAEYNSMRDSAAVIIKGISSITILPKNIVTDTIRTQKFKMRAFDSEGIERNLSLSDYNWSLSDSSIGIIDSIGNFKGTSSGATKVTASHKELTDTAAVEVVIKHGDQLLDPLENLNNWVFSTENLDTQKSGISISNNEFTQGNGSFKLDYKFTFDGTKLNYIYLDTDYPLAGVPDSIFLDAKSDGQKHLIYYIIEDDNQEQFKVPIKKYFEIADRFDIMGASFQNATEIVTGSIYNFPVTLKQVAIKLASARQAGQVYSGTLYLDNIRISYPDDDVTLIVDGNNLHVDFYLSQNYPNPFNPSTKINFTIEKEEHVSLKIYDILGREITTLVKGKLHPGKHEVVWNASNLPSGVYIYRLQAEGKNLSRKMILLK